MAKCDVCARDGGLTFSVIRHVKRDGRWTTRAAGSIYLCEDCWQRGPNARRLARRERARDPSTPHRRRAARAASRAELAAVEREDPDVDHAEADD